MHFPDEKIIYTIPIYSMPKKEFKRRWDKWKNDWRERSQQMEHRKLGNGLNHLCVEC